MNSRAQFLSITLVLQFHPDLKCESRKGISWVGVPVFSASLRSGRGSGSNVLAVSFYVLFPSFFIIICWKIGERSSRLVQGKGV